MFGKPKKKKRFIVKISEEHSIGLTSIIVDSVTGVNYLLWESGGTSMTPLLDANGKVIVDEIIIEKE